MGRRKSMGAIRQFFVNIELGLYMSIVRLVKDRDETEAFNHDRPFKSMKDAVERGLRLALDKYAPVEPMELNERQDNTDYWHPTKLCGKVMDNGGGLFFPANYWKPHLPQATPEWFVEEGGDKIEIGSVIFNERDKKMLDAIMLAMKEISVQHKEEIEYLKEKLTEARNVV